MAFLCPSGLGRSRQQREIHSSILERIDSGDDFDPKLKLTIARDPEGLVLHNFTASTREELTVKQGQKIHILLREGDWVYVVNSDKKEGFIPFTACAQIVPVPSKTTFKSGSGLCESEISGQKQVDRVNNNTYNVKKSVIIHREPKNQLDNSFYSNFTDDSFISTDNNTHKNHEPVIASKIKHDDNRNIIKSFFESTPYEKLPKFLEIFNSMSTTEAAKVKINNDISSRDRNWSGDANESSFLSEDSTEALSDNYIALFDFRGRHTDDIDVKRDDRVTVLDKNDPFWYWVKKENGAEGYVPSTYIGHIKDPKVATLIGKRKQREGVDRPETHSPEECFSTSPFSETSSVSSSTLNSETKLRPPKPPRTRKHTPKDSVKANRKMSPDNREKGRFNTEKIESRRESRNNRHSSKPSAHHLSLENLSITTDENHCADYKADISRNQANSKHSRKGSSQHKRTNYREYRSNSQRSYTFEESSDYFDAYFCDEPDPNFKASSSDKDHVINVAEILKTRSASTGAEKRVPHKNTWMKSGSADHAHNILNLRQFIQSMPSTSICNDNNAKRSGTDSDLPCKSENRTKSNTDKHTKGQTRKLDWSFGYPRKVRSNQNSINSSSHAAHLQQGTKLRLSETSSAIITNKQPYKHSDKLEKNSRYVKSVGSQTDINDISVQVPDLDNTSDQMFLDLLSATDNLLEVSEKILTSSKSKKKTRDIMTDTGGDMRSSSNESNDDVDEKCRHFIMNQVIDTDIGQLTNRSEASIEVSLERNENSRVDYTSKNDINEHEKYIEKVEKYPDKTAAGSILSSGGSPSIINVNKRKTSHTCQQESNNSCTSFKTERNVVENSDSIGSDVLTTNKLLNSDCDCVFDDARNCLDVHGVTEFVVQFDYETESDMALPIVKNEILHISLDIQEDDHWYWAFSPRLRTYGYVPKQYVKIPLVTIL